MSDGRSWQTGATLARVLDNLGGTVLGPAVGAAPERHRVTEIVIFDQHDDTPCPPGAIVLGVGLREPADIADLLHWLGKAQAAALVIRAPVDTDDLVRAAQTTVGIPVLTLVPGATWAQVAALLRSILSDGEEMPGTSQTLAGVPAGDLFSLANAISALVDAPVTIEDTSSRVVAFSADQDQADDPRIRTILGRQVPEQYLRLLEEQGIFARLYRSTTPIYFELPAPALPRMAIAVRAGDETLGSMWAAVEQRPTSEQEQAFTESAKVAALHMLRQRAGADIERRLRAELVATILEGGAGAFEAGRRLQLTSSTAVVLAFGMVDIQSQLAARSEAERQRLADALALYLTGVHPRSASALVGGIVYGILPVALGSEEADLRAKQVAVDFLDRTGNRLRCAAGIGRIATGVKELAQSRMDADRALRVLRFGFTKDRIARINEVYATALLLELSDLIAAETALPHGPLSNLVRYDEQHNAQLVQSLRAWLDAFGDVNAAAAAVHVHPSTFRYRLRRVAQIANLDLADAEQRFAAMLQLRLLDTTEADNTAVDHVDE
ncbi:PucR family transcriptional regulator [Kribbella turkmenica]|uniref:PucR family transcriptional regulator n=1 Tax=Kribbella turkmenica TaxID=2530375 RepID=A0A4R4WI85_9ACTN|nr:helix-turn-helix domain-containing protein [Kribbella turkmenica]TDD17147.1 PucR family transcriptional regulator [Kribbella turkmenica]